MKEFKLAQGTNIAFELRNTGEIWSMSLPGGREERIRADFLGVTLYNDFAPGWDGTEMVIVKRRFPSKTVMIENLFK